MTYTNAFDHYSGWLSMWTRRRFLSTGVVAVVAACAGCASDRRTGKEDTSRRSLQLELSHVDGPLRDRYVVDLSSTRPDWDAEAFNTTRDGDRYTTQYRKPFFSTSEDPKYAKRDGTYYQLGSVIVDEVTETHPVLRLGDARDADGDPSGNGGEADQLPEVDQRAIHIAHMATRARENEGGVPWGLVDRGGYVYRQEGAAERSRLLSDGGPAHVIYRDTRYTVNITREQFHEPVYRATIEPVATSPGQMETILRATFLDARVSRSELSQAARDILARAQGDGYSEPHPYSSEYREVLTALDRRAYLDGDIENDAFGREQRMHKLLYDGEYFDYYLRFRPDPAGDETPALG